LREHEDEFKQAGALLAAVGLGDLNYARFFRDESGISFPLLIDAERKAYQAAQLKFGNLFHIFRRDNSEARARARAAGHRQHGLGKDPFQLGASFVFAPANRDLLIHLNRTFSDNADPKALLAALR
jgi:AhpC/TSA antioxidant enzyme